MERGLIVDRNGERLAVSVPVGDIYIDRHDFKENQTHLKYEAELREMAKLLDIDYDWLLGRILDPKAGRVLSVKRRVDAKYESLSKPWTPYLLRTVTTVQRDRTSTQFCRKPSLRSIYTDRRY